jgi:hypothetical protein
MTRKLDNAAVWGHPTADAILSGFNKARASYGLPLLTRGSAEATETVREQIAKNERDLRDLERWRRARGPQAARPKHPTVGAQPPADAVVEIVRLDSRDGRRAD